MAYPPKDAFNLEECNEQWFMSLQPISIELIANVCLPKSQVLECLAGYSFLFEKLKIPRFHIKNIDFHKKYQNFAP